MLLVISLFAMTEFTKNLNKKPADDPVFCKWLELPVDKVNQSWIFDRILQPAGSFLKTIRPDRKCRSLSTVFVKQSGISPDLSEVF